MKRTILLLAGLISTAAPLASDDLRLIYRIQGQNEARSVVWVERETAAGYRFSTDQDGTSSFFEADRDYDGTRFGYSAPADETAFEAIRDGRVLRVSGTFKGAPLRKQVELSDKLPWYQSFNHQFADFALSGEKRREFLMLRLDTLEESRWQLLRLGSERAESPAGPVEAVRVRLSLTGVLAALWKAELVYRLSDGGFLRYQGLMGGPGSEKIDMILTAEESLTPR